MYQQWQNFLHNYPLEAFNTAEQTINCIIDLSYLGLLKVTGSRAKELLQGQLTCNLEEVSLTKTRLGAHCNSQGRMISLFRIFFYRDSYYLQMPATSIPFALNALKKYAVFFKVELSDASHEFLRIGYCGDALKIFLPLIPEMIEDLLQVDDLLIIKFPGQISRYEILGDFTAISVLWKKLAEKNIFISDTVWKYLDFQASIPQIYPKTSEKFLPHEINLQHLNGISFNKGCYTGQEIIARMQYRGKVKNQIYQASIKTDMTPQLGNDIYNTVGIAGSIVDCCKTDYNNYEMLIITNEIDQTLFLDSHKTYPLFLKQNI